MPKRIIMLPRDTPEQIALYDYVVKKYRASLLYQDCCPIWQTWLQVSTGVGYGGYKIVTHLDLETRPYDIRMMPEPQIVWLDEVVHNTLAAPHSLLRLSQIANHSRIISGELPL